MTQNKLVPCEPTGEMIKAVEREIMYQLNAGLSCQGDIFAKELCEAMFESAPEVSGEPVADLIAAESKGAEGMWHYFDKKLRYIHAHKIEWRPYEDWIKSIDDGMLTLGMFHPTYKPDRTAQLEAEKARLVEALKEHKILGMTSPSCQKGVIDVCKCFSCINARSSALIADMEAKG